MMVAESAMLSAFIPPSDHRSHACAIIYDAMGSHHSAAIASRKILDNSSALSTGDRQAKFVHTTATDFFSFNTGRFGIVSASTGGRFWATASLSVRWTTDLLT